jgi:hypothetical protein
MILNARQEPQGLEPDAAPLGDFLPGGVRRHDAERGSKKLRNAILRLQAPPRRKRHYSPPRAAVERERMAIEVERIKRAAAEHFKLPIEKMTAWRGPQNEVEKRQIAMFLAREVVGASYPEIGRCFGGKDHTTVLHACRVVPLNHELATEATELRKALAK